MVGAWATGRVAVFSEICLMLWLFCIGGLLDLCVWSDVLGVVVLVLGIALIQFDWVLVFIGVLVMWCFEGVLVSCSELCNVVLYDRWFLYILCWFVMCLGCVLVLCVGCHVWVLGC